MTKDEALKMAIEALSQDEGWFEPSKAINACKQALKQPAQEPVAWIVGNHGHCTTKKDWAEKYSNHIKPLFTHPTQPLSDDEINAIEHLMMMNCGTNKEFARAIEQAHGIGVDK